MRDSQGGGESDPAEGVRRRCMKSLSVMFLSYLVALRVRFQELQVEFR